MDIQRSYLLACAIMIFVGAYIPSISLFLNTLCTVRSHKDPARRAFTWLKFALFFFSGYTLFNTGQYIGVFIYYSMFGDMEDPNADYSRYFNVMERLSWVMMVFEELTVLLEMITGVLVMIVLLRLITGLHIVNSGRAGRIGKKLRLVSYGACFVLVTLILTVTGLRIRHEVVWSTANIEFADDCLVKSVQVNFAFRVFLFVVNLGIVVKAIMVKKQTKTDKNLTWASTMLVVASLVWLLHTSFDMASVAAWKNLNNYRRPRVDYQFYFSIFEVVFGIWPQLVALILVFVVGLKKDNGVWSTQKAHLTHLEDGQEKQEYSYTVPEVPEPVAQHHVPKAHY